MPVLIIAEGFYSTEIQFGSEIFFWLLASMKTSTAQITEIYYIISTLKSEQIWRCIMYVSALSWLTGPGLLPTLPST